MMIVNLCIGIIQLVLLPILIGAVTERIASRNWFANVVLTSGCIWNLTVKICMSWFLLEYVVRLTRDFKNDTTITTTTTTTTTTTLVLACFCKLIIVCLSTQLGSAFQPVGITGSIATGKSTVCEMLLRNNTDTTTTTNFIIIDLDTIGHDILIPGKLQKSDCAYDQLVQVFGTEILSQDNNNKNDTNSDSSNKTIIPPPIDRRKLGDIIFRDDQKRRMLNRITHPLISKIMMKKIVYYGYQLFSTTTTNNKRSVVCVDCPLLFEIGMKMKLLFGIKVVIACHPKIQLKRLMQRNPDLTQEQCQSRIDSQIPVMKKVQMADVVIWNNGTLQDLKNEVLKAQKEILSKTIGYGLSFAQIIFLSGSLYITIMHVSN